MPFIFTHMISFHSPLHTNRLIVHFLDVLLLLLILAFLLVFIVKFEFLLTFRADTRWFTVTSVCQSNQFERKFFKWNSNHWQQVLGGSGKIGYSLSIPNLKNICKFTYFFLFFLKIILFIFFLLYNDYFPNLIFLQIWVLTILWKFSSTISILTEFSSRSCVCKETASSAPSHHRCVIALA